MPHVVISCFKAEYPMTHLERIQDEITRLLQRELSCASAAVSVDLVPVEPDEWKDKVYLPLIVPRLEALIRKPGYSY